MPYQIMFTLAFSLQNKWGYLDDGNKSADDLTQKTSTQYRKLHLELVFHVIYKTGTISGLS